jgi:hypothetical protein
MKNDKLLEIKLDWSIKGMNKLKVSILMKTLHQWKNWKPLECSLDIHAIRTLKCIIWMLSQHSLMGYLVKKSYVLGITPMLSSSSFPFGLGMISTTASPYDPLPSLRSSSSLEAPLIFPLP